MIIKFAKNDFFRAFIIHSLKDLQKIKTQTVVESHLGVVKNNIMALFSPNGHYFAENVLFW